MRVLFVLILTFAASQSHAGFISRWLERLRPAPRAATPRAPVAPTSAKGAQCAEIFVANVTPDLVFPYVRREADGEKFLSQGYSAHVYLVRGEKHLMIKKIYKESQFGVNRFHFDIEGLQALRALHSGFRVAEGERYMEPAITRDDVPRPAARLKYVEGRTVHSLLTDATLSPDLRDRVAEIYMAKFNDLKAKLEASGDLKNEVSVVAPEAKYFFDGLVDSVLMMRAESKTGGPLLIKSDNVVVDPYDLSVMTIVDPY